MKQSPAVAQLLRSFIFFMRDPSTVSEHVLGTANVHGPSTHPCAGTFPCARNHPRAGISSAAAPIPTCAPVSSPRGQTGPLRASMRGKLERDLASF